MTNKDADEILAQIEGRASYELGAELENCLRDACHEIKRRYTIEKIEKYMKSHLLSHQRAVDAALENAIQYISDPFYGIERNSRNR